MSPGEPGTGGPRQLVSRDDFRSLASPLPLLGCKETASNGLLWTCLGAVSDAGCRIARTIPSTPPPPGLPTLPLLDLRRCSAPVPDVGGLRLGIVCLNSFASMILEVRSKVCAGYPCSTPRTAASHQVGTILCYL